MVRKNILIPILFIFTLLTLVGCATQEEESKSSVETRLIKHAMGETEVPANPERIVILTNEGTEALLALNVKPVGAVQSWLGDPLWYPHIKDDMDGVEVVGYEHQVNLEAIVALQPDLIIGNKMRQEDVYGDLSKIAPTVFSETLRGEWQGNFTFYAEVLGLESEGAILLEEYNDNVQAVKALATEKDVLEKEVAVLRFMASTTRLYLENSFSGVILDQIGFKRTTTEDSSGQNFAVEISKEQMIDILKTSDIIVSFTYEPGSGDATSRAKEWLTDPLFEALPAVSSDELYMVSDAIWNTSGGILSANKTVEDLENIVKGL